MFILRIYGDTGRFYITYVWGHLSQCSCVLFSLRACVYDKLTNSLSLSLPLPCSLFLPPSLPPALPPSHFPNLQSADCSIQ